MGGNAVSGCRSMAVSGCRPIADLGLAGHQDPRLRQFYFLIFSDGSCFGSYFLVFSLIFHMASLTFRIIKSQKGLTFSFGF